MKNSVLIHKKQTVSVDKQPEHSWVREEETVYSDIHVSLRTRSRSLVCFTSIAKQPADSADLRASAP